MEIDGKASPPLTVRFSLTSAEPLNVASSTVEGLLAAAASSVT